MTNLTNSTSMATKFSEFWYILTFLFSNFSFSQTVLSPKEFEKQLQSGSIQLLDVRTPEEYSSGHLAHTLQANWNNQEEFQERIKALDKNTPVYIYCLGGGRAAAAQQYLLDNGFKEVINLKGGINAWKQADLPVEGEQKVAQISVETLLKSLPSDKIVLLDFGAEWCPPCKKMNPLLDELTQEGYPVFKIDGAAQKDLCTAYKVSGFPTFIFLKNGIEIERLSGLQTKATLIRKLSE